MDLSTNLNAVLSFPDDENSSSMNCIGKRSIFPTCKRNMRISSLRILLLTVIGTVIGCCNSEIPIAQRNQGRYSHPLTRASLAQFAVVLGVRGGSSPFRSPPRQNQPNVPSTRPWGAKGVGNSSNKVPEKEDEASTKEMIDAFLTRDSRNSFIGMSVETLNNQP